MHRRELAIGTIASVWVLALCSATSAQPVDIVASMRSRVAALAKLTLHPPSAKGLELVRGGLRDPDPSVRAAAARVAHVIGFAEAVAALRAALPSETDREATREMVWALAGLDATDASDEVLVSVATTSRFPEEVVSGIVAGRGPRVSALWSRIKDRLEENAAAVNQGLTQGLHQSAKAVFASFAIRDALPKLAAALLLSGTSEPGSTVAIAAASSSNTRIRSAAFFVLAHNQITASGDLPDLKEPETLLERVARHLFEAATGRAEREGLSTLARELSEDPATQRDFSAFFRGARDAARGLKASEREKLLKAAGLNAAEIDRAVLAKYNEDAPAVRTADVEAPASLRTPKGHPLEFARSVIEAAGCKGGDRFFDGVEATYGPGGRPTRISLLRSEVSAPGCAEAAHILGATALAAEGNPRAISILPQRAEFLACVVETSTRPKESPAEGGDSTVRSVAIGGKIKEPRKIRNVAPRYPQQALAERIQGIVILEAEISPSGCVSGMRVLRGVAPALDLAAMDAVSGWTYTPTLLNGFAVPVIMTVTVNFRLN